MTLNIRDKGRYGSIKCTNPDRRFNEPPKAQLNTTPFPEIRRESLVEPWCIGKE